MMGSTHALNGAVGGALAAPLLGFGPLMTAVSVVITAGAALVPDLDHQNSTATLAHGRVTKGLAEDFRDLSAFAWSRTRTTYDDLSAEHAHDRKGTHRYLTHTIIFSAGIGIFLGTVANIPFMRWLIVGLMISFAMRGFFQMWPNRDLDAWPVRTAAGAVGGYVIPISPAAVGFLITVGCLIHIAADAMTKAGVPALWPIKVRGMYWRRFKTPITASTGHGWFEVGLRWASVVGTVAAVLLPYT